MNSFDVIKNEIQKLAGEETAFTLETPGELSHGDYATNVSLVLSKIRGINPKELAEEFTPTLLNDLQGVVSKVVVAGPGFINFFLTDEKIREENKKKEILTKFTGKNILVEHSSPNLFKPFHIGHLMNNIVGEFVTRAVAKGGATHQELCFPSDISFGIAKAIYVWKKDKQNGVDINIKHLQQNPNEESFKKVVEYFGDCYVRGVALAKENQGLEAEIREIANNLYSEIESGGASKLIDDYNLWGQARNINLEYFRMILESIGSKMGKIIFESEVAKLGKGIVEKNVPTIFTKSEGAIVYIPSEDRKDINTSVFINSEGHPTYEAKDLGLIEKKFTEYGKVDLSYFITDAEQSHHFKVVIDAASKIDGKWRDRAEKSIHIPHGRMLFKGQKMSSRLGGVPLALDVITAVEEEVREKSGDKIAHLTEEEKSKLTRDIALSALRVAVLRSKPGININFDPETSLSFDGDSGPYLMYTHARTSSLLDKGKERSIVPLFWDFAPTTLERHMMHYEEVLEDVINTLSPQKLVSYLFATAQAFNSYYAETQIIVEGDDSGNAHRLAIVARVKHILKDGLSILGCTAPERM